VDLLLCAADPVAISRIEGTLVQAADRGEFDPGEVAATERRVAALRAWLGAAGPAPDLEVVGGAGHRALAAELAARSITLVRDPGGILPVRWGAHRRVLAVMPRPSDLTPADTSSTVPPALAAALRRYHADVDEVVVEPEPDVASIAAVRDRALAANLAVVGTIDGHRLRTQLDLVDGVASTGTPTIAVALRGPWDVAAYPPGVTALATYSILPGSLEALAAVLAGDVQAGGRLPVGVNGAAILASA
jgi:beta-N-acetylhexosaminidase